MGFANAVRTCFAKYVVFSGRASRPEYWYFFLFVVILNIVAGMIDWQFFSTVVSIQSETGSSFTAVSSQPVQGLVGLAVFLPHLAVAWRRMHDSGRSGYYALLPMMLFVGAGAILLFGIGLAGTFGHGSTGDILFTRMTLLVFVPTVIILFLSPVLVLWWLTRPSQPGTNSYGPNPNEVST